MFCDENIVRMQWEHDRNRHPFIGESFSKERIMECWDDCASTYTGEEYSSIRDSIIEDLFVNGVLNKDSILLDIGCGPGLFAIPFTKYVKKVYCIDSSIPMLERLSSNTKDVEDGRIEVRNSTWEDMKPISGVNIAFSSLCPALNDPDSILRMEAFASDHCVYISSCNHDRGMGLEIWNRLGKDYSFEGYDTKYPYQFLQSKGRDPILKIYTEIVKRRMTVIQAKDSELRRISQYRKISPEIEDIVTGVVMSHQKDGFIDIEQEMRLGVMVWKPKL